MWNVVVLRCIVATALWTAVAACGPTGGFGGRHRGELRPRTPLVFKQHEPNVGEHHPFASGPAEGRIQRGDRRYTKELIMFSGYASNDGVDDVVIIPDDGSGHGRLMSERCVEKLKALAISVMNQWPGQKLRVVDGWIENVKPGYPNDSLHYEGRAVDITTSDRDRSKIGMLARLAVEAGFDWVYYETKAHIHCSVKSESSQGARTGGCFSGSGRVMVEGGEEKRLEDLQLGERVLSYDEENRRLVYSQVIMFLDRDTQAEKQFLKLRLSGGRELTVTPQHLVIRRRPNSTSIDDVEAVFAARLNPQDELLGLDRNGTKLLRRTLESSELVLARGVIAPLTTAGTIVVDGVVASCYAVFESQTVAHAAFAPVRAYNTVANALTSAGRFLSAPFVTSRLTVKSMPAVNSTIVTKSRDEDGVHWYPKTLYYLSNHLIPSYLLYNY